MYTQVFLQSHANPDHLSQAQKMLFSVQ